MRGLTPRSGTTVVELLTSLVVASIVTGAAYASLLHGRRATHALVQRAYHERSGLELVAVIEALGRQLRYPLVLGDTALQGDLRIGVGVACQVGDSFVALAPALPRSEAGLTMLADLPMPDDRLEFYIRGDSLAPAGWHSGRIHQVQQIQALDGCGSPSAFITATDHGRPIVRVGVSLSPLPPVGSPIELYRRIRLVAYRDGGNLGWMVGVRFCGEHACGSVQPLAGPIRSPREMGVMFHQPGSSDLVRFSVHMLGAEGTTSGLIRAAGPAR